MTCIHYGLQDPWPTFPGFGAHTMEDLQQCSPLDAASVRSISDPTSVPVTSESAHVISKQVSVPVTYPFGRPQWQHPPPKIVMSAPFHSTHSAPTETPTAPFTFPHQRSYADAVSPEKEGPPPSPIAPPVALQQKKSTPAMPPIIPQEPLPLKQASSLQTTLQPTTQIMPFTLPQKRILKTSPDTVTGFKRQSSYVGAVSHNIPKVVQQPLSSPPDTTTTPLHFMQQSSYPGALSHNIPKTDQQPFPLPLQQKQKFVTAASQQQVPQVSPPPKQRLPPQQRQPTIKPRQILSTAAVQKNSQTHLIPKGVAMKSTRPSVIEQDLNIDNYHSKFSELLNSEEHEHSKHLKERFVAIDSAQNDYLHEQKVVVDPEGHTFKHASFCYILST